ncbi:Hypothetical protein HVR_LOCUS858 [uncultured virus]|nr:Hypothetical protein HVR_LOCUS858 [uncultured virus]
MLKKTKECETCLGCGKSKIYPKCDDCKKMFENGFVINGEIVCNLCHEKREPERENVLIVNRNFLFLIAIRINPDVTGALMFITQIKVKAYI